MGVPRSAVRQFFIAATVLAVFPAFAVRAGDFKVDAPSYLSDDLGVDTDYLELGTWKLRPTLKSGVGYTDNIEKEPDARADFIATNEFELDLSGKAGNYDLSITGSIDSRTPAKTPTENELNSEITLDVKRDFADDASARLKFEFTDLRTAFGTEDIDHERILQVRPELQFATGDVTIELRASAGLDMFPGEDDDTRQHRFAKLQLSASRPVSEDLTAFVGLMLRGTRFDIQVDDDGYRRGGTGYGVLAGLRGDITPDIGLDVTIGAIRQTFRDPDWRNLDYVSISGALWYKPSDATQVILSGDTGFTESEDYGAAGLLTYKLKARGEYKPIDRMVLFTQTSFEHANYLYADIIERTTSAEAGVDVELTRNSVLSMEYKHVRRRSGDPDETFASNSVFTRLRIN